MSLEDWWTNSDGTIEVTCEYQSCCSWGTAYGTFSTDSSRQLYDQLKAIFEPEEKGE